MLAYPYGYLQRLTQNCLLSYAELAMDCSETRYHDAFAVHMAVRCLMSDIGFATAA